MATLPNPNGIARAQARPSMVTASEKSGGEGEALAQFGQGLAQFGQSIVVAAKREEAKLVAAEVQQGSNDLNRIMFKRQFGDPDDAASDDAAREGWGNQRGINAMRGPGGESQAANTNAWFAQDVKALSEKMTPRGREAFATVADQIVLRNQAAVATHGARELSRHYAQTAADTLEVSKVEARAHYGNPEALSKIRGDTALAAAAAAEHDGEDPTVAARKAVGNVEISAMEGALMAGDVTWAHKRLRQPDVKDALGDNLLSMVQKVDQVRGQYAAVNISNWVKNRFTRSSNPTDDARNVLKSVGGPPMEGKAFTKLAADNNGDILSTFAAGLAGQPQVTEWKARATEWNKAHAKDPSKWVTWLDSAPEGVRKRALSAKAAYDDGQGAPEPVDADIETAAAAEFLRVNVDATPGMVEAGKHAVRAQLSDMAATRRDRQNRAIEQVVHQVNIGAIKDYSELPRDVTAGLDKTSRAAVVAYIDTTNNRRAETSPDAILTYEALRADTARLAHRDAPGQIVALAPIIGTDGVKKLMARRQAFLDDPNAARTAQVSADMITSVTSELSGSAKDVALKRAQIRDQVDQELVLNPKANPRELAERAMLKLSVKSGDAWFAKNKHGYQRGTNDAVQISKEDRVLLDASLVANGIPVNEANRVELLIKLRLREQRQEQQQKGRK